MAYREVTMLEVKEILRLWLGGVSKKRIAAQLGLNVKTVRRYVGAAWASGLAREAGPEALDEGLIAAASVPRACPPAALPPPHAGRLPTPPRRLRRGDREAHRTVSLGPG